MAQGRTRFRVLCRRKQDRPRFVSVIAERISRLPTTFVGELEYAVTEWLMRTSDGQLFKLPKAFELVWAKLIVALRERAATGASTIVRQKTSPEWATEALNAPAGKLAQVVMNDPQTSELKIGGGLSPSWRQQAEDLLSLDGDPHRHALTIFLERWSEEKDENRTWPKRARIFLTNVWPRHKAAKTSRTSARLCELACSTVEMFEEVADIVTGLATTIEQEHVALFKLTDWPETIVDRYPEQTLALLSAVLSTDVSKWPYRIETVLDRIAKADPRLLKDGRLVELRRRWDAR